MKLDIATTLGLEEIKAYVLMEAGEAPLWTFDYDKHKADPTPNVVVLGAYRHPRTGNALIGGINVNYLNQKQVENLRSALPEIMSKRNLYYRYHAGRNSLPGIFDPFYRTYNPKYIKNVTKDFITPRLSPEKTNKEIAKAKVDKLKKTRSQRRADAMPDYSPDIEKLDVTSDREQEKTASKDPMQNPSAAAQIQQARDNYLRKKQEQELAYKNKLERLKKDRETADYYDEPEVVQPQTQQSQIKKNTAQAEQDVAQPVQDEPLAPRQPVPTPAKVTKTIGPEIQAPAQALRPTASTQVQPKRPANLSFDDESNNDRRANLSFEDDPVPQTPDSPQTKPKLSFADEPMEQDLEESLIYFDPRTDSYIIEPAFGLFSHWKPLINAR